MQPPVWILLAALASAVPMPSLTPVAPANPASPAAVTLDRIAAVVNDGVITESALASRVREVKKQLLAQHIAIPDRHTLRHQVLDRMVLDRLQTDYANEVGVKISEAELDRAYTQLAARNHLDATAFDATLAKDGIDPSRFKTQLRTELVVRDLIRREIQPQIEISDREIDDYLARQQSLGDTQYHLRDIFIPIDAHQNFAAAMALLNKVRAQLAAGTSFSELAIAYSQGPQALNGGDLGWKNASDLPPAEVAAVQTLTAGGVAHPIETADGLHLLKLVAKKTDVATHVVTQTELRHLLIRPNALVSSAEALGRAKRLRARLAAGADFAKLAAQYSDDPVTASQGGMLGWLSPGELDPRLQAAIDALPVGGVSDPMVTPTGVEIFEVVARRQRDIAHLLDTAQARSTLEEQRARELYDRWLRDLRDRSYVRLIPDGASHS